MSKVGRQLLAWDTLDITQAQAKYLKESGDEEYQGKTDDELFRIACEDPDLLTYEWDALCDWRSLNGEKLFHATTGRELLRAVLPDCDCTFKVYRYGRGLAINNAHHDSPTWAEWYYILPCKAALAA